MVFNGSGTDQQALVSRQKPGIQPSNQHSLQAAPSPDLEGPERLKAGPTGAEQREDGCPRHRQTATSNNPMGAGRAACHTPSPAVELDRQLPHQPTRAHEQARSLSHSVLRSLDPPDQAPANSSIRCFFSDLWLLGLGWLMASLLRPTDDAMSKRGQWHEPLKKGTKKPPRMEMVSSGLVVVIASAISQSSTYV